MEPKTAQRAKLRPILHQDDSNIRSLAWTPRKIREHVIPFPILSDKVANMFPIWFPTLNEQKSTNNDANIDQYIHVLENRFCVTKCTTSDRTSRRISDKSCSSCSGGTSLYLWVEVGRQSVNVDQKSFSCFARLKWELPGYVEKHKTYQIKT